MIHGEKYDIVLTLITLKYFCIIHREQRVFQFEIIIDMFQLALSHCKLAIKYAKWLPF